jgi:ElaB/YqjD/DUF883 family membrane-anchored ribosome-binding protein
MEKSMASSSPSDAYRDLCAESAALKEHIEQLAVAMEQAAKAEGAEALKAFSERVRDILSRATVLVDELTKGADEAKFAAAEGREHLEDSIRKQPLLAVGIAAAVGFLLASLRRR